MLPLCSVYQAPLEIETGQYTSTPRDEKLCEFCNFNIVEDEFHNILSCISYQMERSSYYVENILDIEHFMLMPDADKLAWMLEEENIKDTGKCISSIYQTRRSILFKRN